MATTLFFLSLLLLFLSSPSSAASRRHHTSNPTPLKSSSWPASSSVLVQQACNATRFPNVCVSTMSQSAATTPVDLIRVAISTASTNLTVALSISQDILGASAGNPNLTNAANNCIELLNYSAHRLAQASQAVTVGTPSAMAWMGAALLYQYDCFSALKYVNGTKQVNDAMWYLLSLSSITSNALSMLFSYRRFGNDTSKWIPPQTERNGYWGDSVASPVGEYHGFRGGFASDLTLVPDATVCKEGEASGCYSTVQDAVNAAPKFGSSRFVIYIMAGLYDEIVRVPFEKTNVVFIGDGMQRTVITGSLNAQMTGLSTYNTATVAVNGDGFMAMNLTFQNTAGPDKHQAVAFRSDSDFSVLENVEFLGHQDTLYVHSLRQLYKSCRIAGTVDFVFGNSASVFQDCVILIQPRQLFPANGETNTVTAHGRTDPAQSTGFVFQNCTINGTDDYMALYRQNPARHKNYLGRPWKEYSRTVFIQCYLEELIRPEGWLPWDGDFALSTLFYGEYESSGPGSNVSGRVSWSNQIPANHVGVYSMQNFIQGCGWSPDQGL